MIDYPPLRRYRERYADLAMVPLRVVAELRPGGRIAGFDYPNLDNLLARAVVDEATAGARLPATPESYDLPVPLLCLWREPESGLPLWAATRLAPDGDSVRDVTYWHKRAQRGAWTGTKTGRFSITPTSGRWMARRVPLPTIVCDRWTATAIGNPEEVGRLLSGIAWIGKRRTMGFAEVVQWLVEPLDEGFSLVKDGVLTRSLPAAAREELLATAVPEGEPSLVGWSPPQWKPDLLRPGWTEGTPVAA